MGGLLLGPMISYHLDRTTPYNEKHPALGYVHESGWGGGVYRNSYGKTSAYGGKEFRVPINGLLDAGVTVGAVTGYPKSSVVPMVLPSLMLKTGGSEWALLLQPPVKGATKGALVLQYRKRLK